MELIIHILDMIGTAVFAITGALAAGKKRMDIFGVLVLGCVTALGGGTLRDLILGVKPVFWVSDKNYLIVCTIFVIGTFMIAQRLRLPSGLLMYADGVGLAVFTVIGFQKGFYITHMYSISIVTGIATGVAGGIIRDVLSGEIPLVFRKEIYASASFCGGVLLAIMLFFKISESYSIPAAILTTLCVRIASVHWGITLPLFRLGEDKQV